MHDLEITWPSGQKQFSPEDSPITIGRLAEASIPLIEPSVSRHHIEFVWSGSAWLAQDSSAHGSFDPIGVRLASTWTVGTGTTIRVGGIEGVEVRIELVTTRAGSEPEPSTMLPRPEVPLAAPPSLKDLMKPAPSDAKSVDEPSDAAKLLQELGMGADLEPWPPEPAKQTSVPSAPHPTSATPPSPAVISFATNGSLNDGLPAFLTPTPANPPSSSPPPAVAPPSAPTFGFSSNDSFRPGSPEDQFKPQSQKRGLWDAPPKPVGNGSRNETLRTSAAAPAGSVDLRPQPNVDNPPNGKLQFASPEAATTRGSVDASPRPKPQPGPAPAVPSALPTATPPPAAESSDGIAGVASATAVTGDTIQLSIDGEDFTFLPGTEITIGRDPACLLVVAERHTLVSRRHLHIAHRDDYWWITDYSSKGTYINGRRASKPYKAEGAFLVNLGDGEAGTPLKVIAPGEHKPSHMPNIRFLAAIGLLAILAAVLGYIAFGPTEEPDQAAVIPRVANPAIGAETMPTQQTAAANLDLAKKSTVLLLSGDGGLGSGFFVTDNLIVTNQHVAVLAEELFVAVSRTSDEPAQIEFRAETLELHPYLDIAVLKITTDNDGNPVTSSGLPSARLGTSADLTLGDAVYNTGFPSTLSLISRSETGDVRLPPVSATSGQAASWSIWPGCANLDAGDFIPKGSPPGVGCSPIGDVDKGIVITTFSSGQGASGSPVFQGSEVLAVVFAGPEDEANAGRNITADSFGPWLERIIASNN